MGDATDREGRTERGERAPGSTQGSPAYEPPAIAWEEAFEPLAQTSCGLIFGMDQDCNSRPST